MINDECISKATLGRLPVYLRYLESVRSENKSISSTHIARALGLGEVQVRKDLASVSGRGKPKKGYDTDGLIHRLEECLGKKSRSYAIIVGAGKLGKALLDYDGFSDYGIEIIAAFDKQNREVTYSDFSKPIYPMSELENFCFRSDVKTGIITVPKESAQQVCDELIRCNVQAIWSFAPATLKVPDTVILRQENLALSLAHLTNTLKK